MYVYLATVNDFDTMTKITLCLKVDNDKKKKKYTHKKKRKNNLALKIQIHALDEVDKAVLYSVSATGHSRPEKVHVKKKPNRHKRPRAPYFHPPPSCQNLKLFLTNILNHKI